MKIEDIKKMAQAWNQVQEASYGKKKEAMDPVDQKALKGKHKDRKDKDIDNDGDVDSSDEYLHKRSKAVSKAIKGKGKETEVEVQTQESVELDELSKKTLGSYMKKADKQADKAANSYSSAAARRSDFANDTPAMAKNAKKFAKRDAGAELARSKLAKEANDMRMGTIKVDSDAERKKRADAYNAKKKTESVDEAKSHGNTDNGSPAGEGLSPSAKDQLANKTPAPSDAFDATAVNKKTFDAMRASAKKAPMRSNDNAAGDKTAPKTGK